MDGVTWIVIIAAIFFVVIFFVVQKGTKTCHFCKKSISVQATVCPHCGRNIS